MGRAGHDFVLSASLFFPKSSKVWIRRMVALGLAPCTQGLLYFFEVTRHFVAGVAHVGLNLREIQILVHSKDGDHVFVGDREMVRVVEIFFAPPRCWYRAKPPQRRVLRKRTLYPTWYIAYSSIAAHIQLHRFLRN